MDEVIQLRTEHVKVEVSMFIDLLLSQAESINKIRRNHDQRLNENESKIKELVLKLTSAKGTLNTKTQTLEEKTNELTRQNACQKALETEEKKFSQEIKQLKTRQNILMSSKPNLQDLQILEQGKKKLKLYKNLTGIRWDYEAIKHSIKGYISNDHNYIHHFCYENQMINEKLVDALWCEIHLSTGETPESVDKFRQLNIPVDTNVAS